jgi:hypothetical protein
MSLRAEPRIHILNDADAATRDALTRPDSILCAVRA